MNKNEPYAHEGVLLALDLYVRHGVKPGGFLTAVLQNKLKEAYQCADDYNTEHMWHLVKHLYWEIPAEAWGSEEKFEKWIKHRNENK